MLQSLRTNRADVYVKGDDQWVRGQMAQRDAQIQKMLGFQIQNGYSQRPALFHIAVKYVSVFEEPAFMFSVK